MLGTGVHLQHLLDVLPRQRGLRQHAPDGLHDDEIAPVDVRRERRFVLATQDLCDAAGEPAERLSSRINQPPPTLDVLRLQRVRLHALLVPWILTDANYTRGVSACQPEGCAERVTSGAPFSTRSPALTWTCCTTPRRGARSSFSIFIASTTTRPAPASTSWPAVTSTRTTSPGIGALTTPLGAGRRPCPVRASICFERSSCTSTSKRSPAAPNAQRRPASSSC